MSKSAKSGKGEFCTLGVGDKRGLGVYRACGEEAAEELEQAHNQCRNRATFLPETPFRPLKVLCVSYFFGETTIEFRANPSVFDA